MSTEEKPLPFIYQFMAGAMAGISEVLIMYPLDVVKTRMQLQVGIGAQAEYKGVIDCFSKMIKREGFGSLYRGIVPPILMEAPKRATKFAANDEWGKFYRKQFGTEKMTQSLSILTGATAGATESLVVVPFELIKIRLQDKNSKYKNARDVLKNTIKGEGIVSLYNGLEATMWRQSIWNAGYFGVIFQVKSLLPKPTNQSEKTRNDLISGFVGGTVGTMLNTPFDVIKSRIQSTPRIPGTPPKYNWALPSLVKVFSEGSFRAMYKGFVPKVLRLGPGGGIMLVVYNTTMNFFRGIYYKKEKPARKNEN
ncbi:Mitochondrial 2-oxodicarboxylate carrier 2 [Brettanomyces nanus]|uniref:Mitochondrial 2-oxodicarboxylate carrier 2 n=1 Tax=Eeniella nana TaxID=13502 RepID=A0A875SE74_EENNA|nr:Mitochondrial 2-oxodicarboxylate carrier 2 [Brettanomyces nanus]QPG76964.1 Mitochondrial 2-oxodicarboxylate carrier 2 [Brettanomyces nanus]